MFNFNSINKSLTAECNVKIKMNELSFSYLVMKKKFYLKIRKINL